MDFAEFKSRINATPVSPELLGEVMVMIAKLSPAERDAFETRTARVADFVEKKGFGEAAIFVAIAITVRLMALDSVLDDRLIKEWLLLPAAECGGSYVRGDLLRVVAEEPVLEGPDGQPIFAIASLRERLTASISAEGRA